MNAHVTAVNRNQRNPSAWSPDFSRFGVRNPESYAPASRKLNMQAPHRLKPGLHASSPVCPHDPPNCRPAQLRSFLPALILGIITTLCLNCPARVPATHEHQGTIASIDRETHLLILTADPKPHFHLSHTVKPSRFAWNDETQFIKDGNRTNSGAFSQGETVRLFYRYSARKQPPLLLKVAS